MRDDRRRELTPRDLQRQRRKEQIQRRRLVAVLCLLGLIIVIIVLVATCGPSDSPTSTSSTGGSSTSTTLGTTEFKAELVSSDTDATGTLTMNYDPSTEELTYELYLNGVDSPTTAALFEGAEGEEGVNIYSLYADTSETGPITARIAEGSISVAKFTGTLEGKTLADLVQLLTDGSVYVSVGTADTPTDALRAQIAQSPSDTTLSSDDTSDTSDTSDTLEETTTTKKSTSTTKKKTTTTT
jgi:hypothetical protein